MNNSDNSHFPGAEADGDTSSTSANKHTPKGDVIHAGISRLNWTGKMAKSSHITAPKSAHSRQLESNWQATGAKIIFNASLLLAFSASINRHLGILLAKNL